MAKTAMDADTITNKDAKWLFCPKIVIDHTKPNPDPSVSALHHAQM